MYRLGDQPANKQAFKHRRRPDAALGARKPDVQTARFQHSLIPRAPATNHLHGDVLKQLINGASAVLDHLDCPETWNSLGLVRASF